MKKNLRNNPALWISIIGIGLVVLWGASQSNNSESGKLSGVNSAQARIATIYKSPTCGCCGQYGAYLKSKGYKVKVKAEHNMDTIKSQYGIPQDMASCHTMIIDNYVVEGHVPVEAVEQLLTERPEIDGITLPRMPAGSPGMPGIKQGPFQIFSLKDGHSETYINL
jgi:hypothetical protein